MVYLIKWSKTQLANLVKGALNIWRWWTKDLRIRAGIGESEKALKRKHDTWGTSPVNTAQLGGSPQVPVHKHMQSGKQIARNPYKLLRTSEEERLRSMEKGSLDSWCFALEQVTNQSRADGSRSGWVQWWVSDKDWLIKKRKWSLL